MFICFCPKNSTIFCNESMCVYTLAHWGRYVLGDSEKKSKISVFGGALSHQLYAKTENENGSIN